MDIEIEIDTSYDWILTLLGCVAFLALLPLIFLYLFLNRKNLQRRIDY